MSVSDQVKRIVCEQGDISPEDIKVECKFIEDLGFDSLGLVELIMALEQNFEIEIPDNDAERLKTVQDAIDYINEHKHGQ